MDLALAVLFGTMQGIAYKAAAQAGCRRFHIIAVERSVIVLIMALYSLKSAGFELNTTVALIGLAAGICVFVARWLLLKALAIGSAGTTWAMLQLSISIPVLASIFLWGEIPRFHQGIGLILVPVGVILMRKTGGTVRDPATDKKQRAWLKYILACFFAEGAGGLCLKAVSVLNLAGSRNMFILIMCFTAVVLCAAVLFGQRSLPNRKELSYGSLAGIFVGPCAIFWLRGILSVPAIIFFPVVTASVIVLISVLSRLIWKERMTLMQKLGIGMAVGAAILIACQ